MGYERVTQYALCSQPESSWHIFNLYTSRAVRKDDLDRVSPIWFEPENVKYTIAVTAFASVGRERIIRMWVNKPADSLGFLSWVR